MSRIEQPEHPCSRIARNKKFSSSLTGERGLAGAFNSNILRKANEFFRPNKGKEAFRDSRGEKGRDALRKAGFPSPPNT